MIHAVADELKYFDDSRSSGVTLRDGKPIQYWSRADPPGAAEQAELAERIRALTGHAVRFGSWKRLSEENPLEQSSEVPLTVID